MTSSGTFVSVRTPMTIRQLLSSTAIASLPVLEPIYTGPEHWPPIRLLYGEDKGYFFAEEQPDGTLRADYDLLNRLSYKRLEHSARQFNSGLIPAAYTQAMANAYHETANTMVSAEAVQFIMAEIDRSRWDGVEPLHDSRDWFYPDEIK